MMFLALVTIFFSCIILVGFSLVELNDLTHRESSLL